MNTRDLHPAEIAGGIFVSGLGLLGPMLVAPIRILVIPTSVGVLLGCWLGILAIRPKQEARRQRSVAVLSGLLLLLIFFGIGIWRPLWMVGIFSFMGAAGSVVYWMAWIKRLGDEPHGKQ